MFGSLRMEMASGLTFGYFLQAVPAALLAGIVYAVLRLMYLKRKKRQIVWFPEIMRVLFVCYLVRSMQSCHPAGKFLAFLL